MLRARVIDPAGPPWWRAATLLAGFSALGIAAPLGFAPAAAVTMVALAWTFLARPLLTRLRPRVVELTIEPGAVRLRRAGILAQRIGARDLCAASSATTSRGESIALVRGVPGDRPLVLELSTREDAAAVRRALGIGARGFGEVTWPSTSEPADGASISFRTLSALGWIAMAASVLVGPAELTLGLALLVIPLSILTLALIGSGDPRLAAPRATPDEREHLEAHRAAAAERARHASDHAPSATLAPLARGPGEDGRAWLERVDAMAASLSKDDGYRGGGLEPEQLWETLGDPDAAPPMRAVAARVLARVAPEEARRRIGDALSVERDARTRQGIQAALEEDVETAARGLDRLGR